MQQELLQWYKSGARQLPWRETQDPYRIWISEIMLQQTTTKAVIPYYERFLNRFPDIYALANSRLEDVFEFWAGLGYYSRARHLHAAAHTISQNGFPTNYKELLQLPGFGPYIARAVASFAFQEKVGVLDGNVIRFLSRFHNQNLEWWKPKERDKLQKFADQWANHDEPDTINQALIEIGSTICTPTHPSCMICPVFKKCQARKEQTIEMLPLKKPKRKNEIWLWQPKVQIYKNKVWITRDNPIPFLKNHWCWPGHAKKIKQKPKQFDYQHTVTHHQIYVQVEVVYSQATTAKDRKNGQWVKRESLKKWAPTTLVHKALQHIES